MLFNEDNSLERMCRVWSGAAVVRLVPAGMDMLNVQHFWTIGAGGKVREMGGGGGG